MLEKKIQNVEEKLEALERVVLVFKKFLEITPKHYYIVDRMLFSDRMKIVNMKSELSKGYDTIQAMKEKENASAIKMLEEMNGHTRNQLITEFLMHYLKTGSEDDMKAADIIADEVFEHTLKRIDELERQVRMLTTGRENIDGNKIWKKFHSEDISINELNEE